MCILILLYAVEKLGSLYLKKIDNLAIPMQSTPGSYPLMLLLGELLPQLRLGYIQNLHLIQLSH